MSIGIGDFVEVFSMPGDNFDPDPLCLQPGDRFVIADMKLGFVTDGKAGPTGSRRFVCRDRVRKVSDDDQLFTKWARDHLITEPLIETARRIHPSVEEINRKAYAPGWLGETTTKEAGRGS